MRLLRVVASGLVAVLLLSLVAALAGPAGAPVRVAAGAASSCVDGNDLVVNGSFESPRVRADGETAYVTPDGWTGQVGVVNSVARYDQGVDGDQYVIDLDNGLSQALPTAGLDNLRLNITFKTRTGAHVPSLSVGGEAAFVDGPPGAHVATYFVPSPAPATTTIAFSGVGAELDGVSVIVSGCYRAVDDEYTVTEDTPFSAPEAIGLQANDGIPEGYARGVYGIDGDGPRNGGTFTRIGIDGSFTFVPTPNVSGVFTYTYRAGTGAREDTGTITITILPVDDGPPVFDASTVPSPAPVEAIGPSGAPVAFTAPSATDPDGITPIVTCAAGDRTVTSGGTFAVGSTTVTCTASDGGTPPATDTAPTFTITVQDTTGPVISVPEDITAEATGPSGAPVTYAATAADLVDGAVTPTCSPASGGIFPIGTTSVTCTASDSRDNAADPAGFDVTVRDTTGPTISVPASIVASATGASGAAVPFTVSATDLVDGSRPVTCTAGGATVSSGSTFPLGTTTVSCAASDSRNNAASPASFTITVRDTTGPVISVPANIVAEATGPTGATVSYTAIATDLVDGGIIPTCSPASGSVFPIGTTSVTCTASDSGNNSASPASLVVTVRDTTGPTITGPTNITTEATSSAGATVLYSVIASDVVDGAVTPNCTPGSGNLFRIGTTTVTCAASDRAGNPASPATFTVTVRDTRGPSSVTLVGGPQPGATYTQATLPAAPTCTATDAASPVIECQVFGYETTPGRHTLTARARDAQGNTTVVTRSYTVTASAPTATPRPTIAPRPTATPRPTTPPTAAPTSTARPPLATATPTQPRPTPAPTRRPRG